MVAIGVLDIGKHQPGVSHRLGADQDRAAEFGDLIAGGGNVGTMTLKMAYVAGAPGGAFVTPPKSGLPVSAMR